MWSIEAVIARHESIAMEQQQTEAAGAGGGAQPEAAMKVVVAVDASEESLHALSWALDHVVRFHPGASVVILHAQHRADHFVYPVAAHGLAYAPPTALDAIRKDQEEVSSKVVSRAMDVCSQKQVKATAVVVEGDPKEAICQAAEQIHAGLLVLGSRGLGMIKRALLGSVSDYLAHHARCPVLIVKPPHKAHDK